MFPKDQKKGAGIKTIIRQLDILGIVLFAGGIIFLLSFLLSFSTSPHAVEGVLGLLLLCAFVWRELKTDKPFIDVRLFKTQRNLSAVYVQFILLNVFFYCLFFGLPSYFQDEMHLSVQTSGLFMLFMSGMSIVVSPLTGKWIDRSGVVKPIFAGALLMTAGAVLLTIFFINVQTIGKGLILSLLGIGYGLGNVALQAAMLETSPSNMVGTTSGLFQTCRYLGSILSSVILGILFGKEITAAHFDMMGIIMIIAGGASLLMAVRFAALMKTAS